jgi:hypothetical protein
MLRMDMEFRQKALDQVTRNDQRVEAMAKEGEELKKQRAKMKQEARMRQEALAHKMSAFSKKLGTNGLDMRWVIRVISCVLCLVGSCACLCCFCAACHIF